MKAIFQEVEVLLLNGVYKLDQDAFNWVISQRNKKYSKEIRRLDRLLYPTGYIYYLRKFNQEWDIKPLVIHMNWSEGKVVKKKRLQEFNLWYVGDSKSGIY